MGSRDDEVTLSWQVAPTAAKPQTAGSAHNRQRARTTSEPDQLTAAPSVDRNRPVEDRQMRRAWATARGATQAL
jgi:hypothetical protein